MTVKHNKEVVDILVKVAAYVDKNKKLMPVLQAKKLAKELGKEAHEIEGTLPWYLHQKRLNDNLPSFAIAQEYTNGEKTWFCPSGLYKKVKTGKKPVLEDDFTMPFIHSKPEYSAKLGDAERLASLLNETVFGPTEVRLRALIIQHLAKQQAITANAGNNANAGNDAPPMDDGDRKLEINGPLPEGQTRTQYAELWNRHMNHQDRFLESLNNNTEAQKGFATALTLNAQNFGMAIQGNNKAIEGNNKAVEGNNKAIDAGVEALALIKTGQADAKNTQQTILAAKEDDKKIAGAAMGILGMQVVGGTNHDNGAGNGDGYVLHDGLNNLNLEHRPPRRQVNFEEVHDENRVPPPPPTAPASPEANIVAPTPRRSERRNRATNRYGFNN